MSSHNKDEDYMILPPVRCECGRVIGREDIIKLAEEIHRSEGEERENKIKEGIKSLGFTKEKHECCIGNIINPPIVRTQKEKNPKPKVISTSKSMSKSISEPRKGSKERVSRRKGTKGTKNVNEEISEELNKLNIEEIPVGSGYTTKRVGKRVYSAR
jgi:hypothetical protein